MSLKIRLLVFINIIIINISECYNILLPVRPSSLTYWGLGVMLVPYALDVMYISGDYGGGQQTAFRGAPIIFVRPIALTLLKLGPNSKGGKCTLDHCA